MRLARLFLCFWLAIVAGCRSEGASPSMEERVPAEIDAGDGSPDAVAPSPAVDANDARSVSRPDADSILVDVDAAPADADAAPADADAAPADADAAPADADADASEGSNDVVRVVDWSVRKRLRTNAGADILLEEVLTDLASAAPKPSRIVLPANGSAPGRSWTAPDGTYISDFSAHPSGATSAVLVGIGGLVSLVRLDQNLILLETSRLRDPDVANDPHVTDAGPLDLVAKQLTLDGARIASAGEDVIATVFSSWNSVIAYRLSFSNGAWSAPRRTLVEPPAPLTPNLPIGGSFDTFGAMTAWFRCLLDVDEEGNAYVAVWANGRRIREHVAVFQDGVAPLPGDPSAPLVQGSDVLLTKMDPGGARVWSRVVGTAREDEPYALRARRGAVAVVGRSRRLPGFDNTFWDAFIAVTSNDGDALGARAFAFDGSSIALAVDSLSDGGWAIGGSDGWAQNPGGLSILSYGTKLLIELPSLAANPVRLPLPPGPRHNEIRTVMVDGARIAFGGHEDGPIMHTGDSDPSQIRATGVFGTVER